MLARCLDHQYGEGSPEINFAAFDTQLCYTDLGPDVLEHFATFSAVANQTMFCWVASVSLPFTLCTCCFSINLQLSSCAQKLQGLLLDVTGGDQPESNTKQGDGLHLISVASIPQHLPTCIFFLTRNLSIIHCIVQTKNIFIYDRDLTIIPKREWASGMGWMLWASPPIKLRSLVRIQQSSNYFSSLAIVIATSGELGNENLVVTIVPKIPYPTTTFLPEQYSPSSQVGPSHWKVDHQTADVPRMRQRSVEIGDLSVYPMWF